MKISGVLLAGGQSRRMGADKSLLLFQGERLIERVVRRVRRVSDDLVVVTHQPEVYAGLEVRFAADRVQGVGVLAGIHAGLSAALFGWSLVVGCDMPFLNVGLITYMIGLADRNDLILPSVGGHVEPLHALYHRRCLAAIESSLREGRLKADSFHPSVRVRLVGEDEIVRFDPNLRSFFNLNTPQDWQAAQRFLEGETED